jgi:hypothetical protein
MFRGGLICHFPVVIFHLPSSEVARIRGESLTAWLSLAERRVKRRPASMLVVTFNRAPTKTGWRTGLDFSPQIPA